MKFAVVWLKESGITSLIRRFVNNTFYEKPEKFNTTEVKVEKIYEQYKLEITFFDTSYLNQRFSDGTRGTFSNTLCCVFVIDTSIEYNDEY